VNVTPTAAPIANNAVLAVALAAAASHGVNLLSGCCSLGSLGLRYASIARRRVSNAIVRDFRKRISSITRSSLCSTISSLVSTTLLGMFTVIERPSRTHLGYQIRQTLCFPDISRAVCGSPVARTRFKTLIYLKGFGALASTSKFLDEQTPNMGRATKGCSAL